MAKLTQEHLDFMMRHNISMEEVLDATGMRYVEYKHYMKEYDFLLAYGVTPCQKAGHTFRTRYNHCVMCDPSKIAYVKRKNLSGYVYVAISLKEDLVKIGCAKDCKKRMSSLNRQNYGGVSDWQLVAYFYHEKMGEAEYNIQKSLVEYREFRGFNKENKTVQASEIYRIDPSRVFDRIREVGYTLDWMDQHLVKYYDNQTVMSVSMKKFVSKVYFAKHDDSKAES
mgnify:FL=1